MIRRTVREDIGSLRKPKRSASPWPTRRNPEDLFGTHGASLGKRQALAFVRYSRRVHSCAAACTFRSQSVAHVLHLDSAPTPVATETRHCRTMGFYTVWILQHVNKMELNPQLKPSTGDLAAESTKSR